MPHADPTILLSFDVEEFDAPVALSLGEKAAAASFTVAVSSFGRSQLCRWAPVDIWPRIKVVHCGIEPERFPEPEAAEPGKRLVAIGRFSEQKGFPILIEALAMEVARSLEAKFPQIRRAKITLRKPNAPIAGVLDYVQVTVEHRVGE